MSDYTPTTEEVRGDYATFQLPAHGGDFRTEYAEGVAEFDRWLAAHDAEVLREAVTELEYGIRLDAYPDADVVPVASEQRARAHATVGGVTAMQRTIRAGEWVPVKQEGAEQ